MLPSFKGVITPDLLIVAMDLLLLRKVTEARDAFAGLRETFQRYLFGYLISVSEAASSSQEIALMAISGVTFTLIDFFAMTLPDDESLTYRFSLVSGYLFLILLQL